MIQNHNTLSAESLFACLPACLFLFVGLLWMESRVSGIQDMHYTTELPRHPHITLRLS